MNYSDTYPGAKDPSAAHDYDWNFADELTAAETISTPVVTIADSTATAGTPAISGTKVVVRISGGAAGDNALVTFHVTGSSGQQYERTALLRIRQT